jgi:hypothetical protein
MKKLIYTLLAITLVVSACKKEDEDTAPTNTTVSGCTDNTALNYNALATVDDGSCDYSNIVSGCMDTAAINYNALATVDDGTCDYGPNSVLGTSWIMERLTIDGSATTVINGVSNTTPIAQVLTSNLPMSPLHFYSDGTFTTASNTNGTWSVDNTSLTMTANNETEELYISELNANTLTLIQYNAVDTSYVQAGMAITNVQHWSYFYER